MLTNQIHGIALRLSIDNQNGIDPATVLNLHFEKEKEINDWVYYSTNVSQDSRLTDRISMIVFFFKQRKALPQKDIGDKKNYNNYKKQSN